MNLAFTLRRATLLLALTLPSFCWGFGPPPLTALIVDDGTAFDVNTVESFLTGRLVAAGYTVITNNGVPGGSLSGYKQVWDIRFQNATPLTGSDITAYMTYLTGGGALFVMGENSGFLTRDNSIPPLVTAAGGGNVTILQSANSLNLQTVVAPFTGPVPLTTITFAAIGGFGSIGNARYVTMDANNKAGAIVFSPGTLTNATAGTLIVVLDVNFLTASTGGSQALTDNLIAYLAAPSTITPQVPATPAPASAVLVLTGLGAAGIYFAYRRRQTSA
jgi:hypothetical protein